MVKNAKSIRKVPGKVPIPTNENTSHLVEERNKYLQLANLSISTDKNNLDGDVPIFASVIVGSFAIDSGSNHYRAYVRQCFLKIVTSNMELGENKKVYNQKFSNNEIKFRKILTDSSNSNTSWSFRANATIKAAMAAIGFAGDASADSSSTNQNKQESKVERNLELHLIQALPNLKWRIGVDGLGDIRKDEGFLEGPYFSNDGLEPERKPLCHLRVIDARKPSEVTAGLSVSLRNGLHVVRDGQYASEKPIPEVERDKEFAEAFKGRLRSLSLSEAFGARDSFQIARTRLVSALASGGDT